MQAVKFKNSDSGQVVAFRSTTIPHATNDVSDAEIINFNQASAKRSFPVLGSKISIELVQMFFCLLDAIVLLLASLVILPVVGAIELGVVGASILTFVLFKAYLGGYRSAKKV